MGLTKVGDKRAKYYYEIASEADAEHFLAAIRAPVDPARAAATLNFLRQRLQLGSVKFPVPMRRLIAIK